MNTWTFMCKQLTATNSYIRHTSNTGDDMNKGMYDGSSKFRAESHDNFTYVRAQT